MAETLWIKMFASALATCPEGRSQKGRGKGRSVFSLPLRILTGRCLYHSVQALWLEFNYMAIPAVKEIREFHLYPGKLCSQLAFGSSMIKEEGRMDIEEKLSLSAEN